MNSVSKRSESSPNTKRETNCIGCLTTRRRRRRRLRTNEQFGVCVWEDEIAINTALQVTNTAPLPCPVRFFFPSRLHEYGCTGSKLAHEEDQHNLQMMVHQRNAAIETLPQGLSLTCTSPNHRLRTCKQKKNGYRGSNQWLGRINTRHGQSFYECRGGGDGSFQSLSIC